MKRIPRIKFPQRHPKSSGTSRQIDEMSVNDDGYKNDDLVRKFFSRAPSMSVGGKASDQPKRTPVSQEEIDSIMRPVKFGTFVQSFSWLRNWEAVSDSEALLMEKSIQRSRVILRESLKI
ncbi:hypothetical protein ACS0TY_011715 [Phlomoides rotata]